MSWVQGWQGGLFLGTALTLVMEVAVRRFLLWRRTRGYCHCKVCDGLMVQAPGVVRAEFPVENLLVCGECGDTWPDSIVERTKCAHKNGRGGTSPALRARSYNTHDGYRTPAKPEGPDVVLIKEGRLMPSSGKSRRG